MRLSGDTDHVIVRHSKQFDNLIPHRSLSHHSENRAYITGCKIAPDHSVTLHKGDFRSLPCSSHGTADSGRACPRHDNVIFAGKPGFFRQIHYGHDITMSIVQVCTEVQQDSAQSLYVNFINIYPVFHAQCSSGSCRLSRTHA